MLTKLYMQLWNGFGFFQYSYQCIIQKESQKPKSCNEKHQSISQLLSSVLQKQLYATLSCHFHYSYAQKGLTLQPLGFSINCHGRQIPLSPNYFRGAINFQCPGYKSMLSHIIHQDYMLFSRAAIIYFHKLGGLNNRSLLPQCFWISPKLRYQQGRAFSQGLWGAASSFIWLLMTILGLWLYPTNFCLCGYMATSCFVSELCPL